MVVSVETLQRRIAYGGRKGASARRRLLRMLPHCYITDREELKRFFFHNPTGKRRTLLRISRRQRWEERRRAREFWRGVG